MRHARTNVELDKPECPIEMSTGDRPILQIKGRQQEGGGQTLAFIIGLPTRLINQRLNVKGVTYVCHEIIVHVLNLM